MGKDHTSSPWSKASRVRNQGPDQKKIVSIEPVAA